MSACEKCWSDAGRRAWLRMSDKADEYQALMAERKDTPCTPEEQAGPDATECEHCQRRTRHQHTGECMNPECQVVVAVRGEA